MIQIKTKYIVLGVFLLLLAIFALGGYLGHRKAINASNEVISALKDTVITYEYKIGKLKRYASERDQLIVEQKQAIEQGLLEKKELKALHLSAVSEVTSLKAQIRVILDSIGHNGIITIPCPNTDTLEFINAIYLPFEFNKKTKFIDLKGRFDEEGVLSIDQTISASLDIFTGYDRQKKAYKAVVTSDNPDFKVLEINSIKVEAKKPSRFGLGLQSGYGFMLSKEKVTAQPYIGIGLQYSLIRF
ncbi:MAG: hypothetical protein GX465_16350 [Acidobacteria bacterium]|nr:hypothetical protein [Acidobacteriota bacterium]